MANNISVLDSAAAAQVVKTTDTAGVHTPHHNVDSSALPTGAATAAKQPALGTAGSASSDVITVQGITSMTALKTDGSAVTQPVSGTFWQATQPVSLTSTTITGTVAVTKSGTWDITNAGTFATQSVCTNAGTFAVQADQSGTWTVQPGNTANTTPWLVSLASAMKGTAGTAASEVLTIQGIASMTAIKTDGSATTQPVSGTVTANLAAGTNNIGDVDVLSVIPGTGATNLGKAIDTATGATDTGVLALATRDDALSALTPIEGDNVQLRTDANGALWVIPSGTITVAAHAVTNAGTFAVQVDGAALTALQLIDNPVIVDDAAFTPATSSVMMAGFEADETAPDSVDEGDAGAARMTLDRKQIVTTQVHTSGGESSLSALSTAAVYTAEVKASAGQIYGVEIFNKGAAAVYARLYNQTGAPGSGDAANIIWRGIVPGSATGAGFVKGWPNGKICATGIGIRVSGAIADNDTTVLAANEVTINVGFK